MGRLISPNKAVWSLLVKQTWHLTIEFAQYNVPRHTSEIWHMEVKCVNFEQVLRSKRYLH